MNLFRNFYAKSKKHPIARRLILLLLIGPLLLSGAFFGLIFLKRMIVFEAPHEAQSEGPTYEMSDRDREFKTFINQFSSFTKLPPLFLKFDIYATNDVAVVTEKNEYVDTLLNINIRDIYTGGIATGKTKKIYKGVNLDQLFGSPIEISFNYVRPLTIYDRAPVTQSEHHEYYIFISPQWSTVILFWVTMIPVTYALIVLLSALLRFVLLGTPFREVLEDFERQKSNQV